MVKQRMYIKKYWDEENVMFYLCFEGEEAVKQIEVTSDRTIFLSKDHPIEGDYFLYDQSLSDLDLNEEDFISEEEFDEAWSQAETKDSLNPY